MGGAGGEERQDEQDVDQEGTGDEGEDGEGEQAPVRFRRNPSGMPSKRERDEHETTHIPFREWCPACVMGRGRRHPHRHVHRDDDDQEKRRPIIGMGYFFMKNKKGGDDNMITIVSMHMPVRMAAPAAHDAGRAPLPEGDVSGLMLLSPSCWACH